MKREGEKERRRTDIHAKERKGKEDGKRKRREREKKKGNCIPFSLKRGIDWFTNGIERRNT